MKAGYNTHGSGSGSGLYRHGSSSNLLANTNNENEQKKSHDQLPPQLAHNEMGNMGYNGGANGFGATQSTANGDFMNQSIDSSSTAQMH